MGLNTSLGMLVMWFCSSRLKNRFRQVRAVQKSVPLSSSSSKIRSIKFKLFKNRFHQVRAVQPCPPTARWSRWAGSWGCSATPGPCSPPWCRCRCTRPGRPWPLDRKTRPAFRSPNTSCTARRLCRPVDLEALRVGST